MHASPDFAALPKDLNADGAPRRTGVEVEFAGIDEGRTAQLAVQALGGTARMVNDKDWVVEGSCIGTLQIYLDLALRKHIQGPLKDLGMRLGREVVPVEIVTEPLTRDQMTQLDRLIAVLRAHGAKGTEQSAFYGFGLHLNPEIAGPDAVVRPLLAYAVLEDWMRKTWPIEATRATLPFTDRYPEKLIRALVELGPDAPLPDVIRCYREATLSRNHGLDMLPVFVELHPEIIAAQDGKGGTVKPRPAFHFRLPDCRISDPDWSIETEWRRWHLVEQVAGNTALLRRLCRAWTDQHSGMQFLGIGWPDKAHAMLKGAGLV
ncbi:hypothetical protein BFP70_06415 [Thioclava sp. SK-1]|nr:hypothetical protein BFP70_06415 [Thioclava sp. SK-1]